MTPTAHVRMADAGDLYTSWRWDDDGSGGVAAAPEADVQRAVDALLRALPNPNALEPAFATGAFADYDAEHELAQQLSGALLPYGLAVRLHDLWQRGIRPRLRIQPSPRVAQVPWELIAPDPGLRLVEIADVTLLPPVTVTAGRPAQPWTRDRPVVAVLDPRVPGFRADSALGSVLGRITPEDPLAQRFPIEEFRRSDVDRHWLADKLQAGASRLVYVGHVTAAAPDSGQSEHAELHLACTADVEGYAAAVRTHRPLSAKDLLLDGERWPMPSRVALIACESGGDLRFTEALGLVAAMLHNGAEVVTASRWPLPTDLAFRRFGHTEARPLHDAICEIDTAHEQFDPGQSLNAWQRERLAAWREHRSIGDSPLVWAAFATVAR